MAWPGSCVFPKAVLAISGTLLLVLILSQSRQQRDSDSESDSNGPRSRLKRHSHLDPDSPLKATLLRPLSTSTPFPTLTTQSQPSLLSPVGGRATPPSGASAFPPQNFPHITDWSEVPDRLFIRHQYSGNFSLLNPTLCQGKGKGLKLIILVTSAIENFQHRANVRLTWGNYGRRKDVQIAFVIGDALLAEKERKIQSQFASELEDFGDLILASFPDTYRNLALKSLHMLDWTWRQCPEAEYFLKTDDDVFLNVPGILQFIDGVREGDAILPKIYGHVFSGHYPKRDTSHKHHLNYDLYPYNVTYPNFTSGPAYLMSTAVVKPLFDEALKLPFIPLEDVLITGFSAMNLNIPRVDVGGFMNEVRNPTDLRACDLLTVLAGMTDGSATQMSFVWFNYLMGKALCIGMRR